MYATCLFCHSSLGTNESIEHFPIGRRLAFDAAKGRLWVVCQKCERWNLSPLDERWEAIEEAERAYRDTKKRVATDNIGLARLRDGTDLVRIGAPLRPEFASWRYGDQFGRRRKKAIAIGGVAVAIVAGATMYGAQTLGYATAFTALQYAHLVGRGMFNTTLPKPRLTLGTGQLVRIKRSDFHHVKYVLNEVTSTPTVSVPIRMGMNSSEWKARLFNLVPFGRGEPLVKSFEGDSAVRIMSQLLPIFNGAGGRAKDITLAVNLVEQSPHAIVLLRRLIELHSPVGVTTRSKHMSIAFLGRPLRLALEMALHESDERRALEGELHMLATRWKDAEEIATIADSLTLSSSVDAQFDNLRKKRSE